MESNRIPVSDSVPAESCSLLMGEKAPGKVGSGSCPACPAGMVLGNRFGGGRAGLEHLSSMHGLSRLNFSSRQSRGRI